MKQCFSNKIFSNKLNFINNQLKINDLILQYYKNNKRINESYKILEKLNKYPQIINEHIYPNDFNKKQENFIKISNNCNLLHQNLNYRNIFDLFKETDIDKKEIDRMNCSKF